MPDIGHARPVTWLNLSVVRSLLFFMFVVLTTWPEFACSANQHPRSTVKKKSPQTFAHLVNFSKNWSSMLIIIVLIRALFTWSRRTTRAKDHRLFYLNYPQVNEVEKCDQWKEDVVCKRSHTRPQFLSYRVFTLQVFKLCSPIRPNKPSLRLISLIYSVWARESKRPEETRCPPIDVITPAYALAFWRPFSRLTALERSLETRQPFLVME